MAPPIGNPAIFYAEPEIKLSARPVEIIKEVQVAHKPEVKQHSHTQIVWRNVAVFALLHSFAFYGMYMFLFKVSWATFIFTYIYTVFAGLGITAGAHRLWSHRSYKANFPLRLFLMLGQSASLQNDIHEWVRDHRAHHKFTDTDADPHNAKRGFFFSHMGWLMTKKHEDVKVKGKTIDMSDVLNDPLVRIQTRFYIPLIMALCIGLPTFIPWYFFGEDLWRSFLVSLARYALQLHGTWLVNSAAHIYGMKPYDSSIKPTENWFVSFWAFGEGWHNYHHIFPWDYKAAELGNYRLNITTGFLDLMAKIGWATELKKASEEIIKKRILRTGDGTWPGLESLKRELNSIDHSELQKGQSLIWGWGDADMNEEEKQTVQQNNMISS